MISPKATTYPPLRFTLNPVFQLYRKRADSLYALYSLYLVLPKMCSFFLHDVITGFALPVCPLTQDTYGILFHFYSFILLCVVFLYVYHILPTILEGKGYLGIPSSA